MNKTFLAILFLVSFIKIASSQEKNNIKKVFLLNTEKHFISSGDNFPDFGTKKDSLDKFLIALHKDFTVKDFQNYTHFNDAKIQSIISLLESKNWLHKINNTYKPTIFIADDADGELLYKYAEPISKNITKSIVKNLSKIKDEFQTTEISKTQNFEKWSFLILSNVLLDNWQINNIEKHFLKQKNRPLRNGKNYYCQITENKNSKTEAFGIYGNQYQSLEENKYLGIYGNNRTESTLTTSKNIISKTDNEIFGKIAENYLPELIKILEKHRKYSFEIYSKLGYKNEITFEEFFIWWYHFIYTQSTNEMNSKGILSIPENGNFDFIIIE